jgi:hypothetical protein
VAAINLRPVVATNSDCPLKDAEAVQLLEQAFEGYRPVLWYFLILNYPGTPGIDLFGLEIDALFNKEYPTFSTFFPLVTALSSGIRRNAYVPFLYVVLRKRIAWLSKFVLHRRW